MKKKKKIKNLDLKHTYVLDFLTARESEYLAKNLKRGNHFAEWESINKFFSDVELTNEFLKEKIQTLIERLEKINKIKANVESRVAKKELNF